MILNVLQIIAPIFILIAVGYLSRQLNLISNSTSKEINKFIFYVSLPALLICKISQIDVQISEQWNAYLAILLSTLVVSILGLISCNYLGYIKSKKWVCVHGAIRSNMAFIGLPVLYYTSNATSMNIAALLMGLTIPIYNVLGVVFLTLGKSHQNKVSRKVFIKQILGSIAKNPLIIGCLIGALLYTLKINKTNFIFKNLELLGAISLSLPLICLGVQMNTTINWVRLKQVFLPTFLKLILCPLLGVCFLYLFYPEPDPNIILAVSVLLGCPSAVASYVMAVEMNADHEFAADTVLATTLFSFFSMTSVLVFVQFI
jgi:predicted permease